MFEGLLSNLQGTAVFLIVLSVLILVHEWGHFITAKKLGIRVDEFALGFGPTLFAKHWHGTTYMIKAFPLGGYVKPAGEDRQSAHGKPDELLSRPVGQRALVVVNGPLVNFVLAYVVFIFVFLLGYPGISTRIEEIKPNGPAARAGLKPGDQIFAVNGQKIHGLMNLNHVLEGRRPDRLRVTVRRGSRLVTKEVQPEIRQEPDLLGRVRPVRSLGVGLTSNEIGGTAKGSPAEAAGLKKGDRIVAVDTTPISHWTALQEAVQKAGEKEIRLTVRRGNDRFEVYVHPELITYKDAQGRVQKRPVIGVMPVQEKMYYRFNLPEALGKSMQELSSITTMTYASLYRMVTGALSPRASMTGPVGIFYVIKGASESGLSDVLFIMGVISASLAIFNLLPIIPLDGGHLFLLFVEKIRRRPLSEKAESIVSRVGVGFIILLAVFVFYNDFSRFGIFDKIRQLGTFLTSLFY